MATLANANNLQKYYNSSKHSDVTIELRGKSIRAHKLVLAEGSEYFRACFEGNFKEANSSSIRLQDDNTAAMEDLIKYLYGFEYYGYDKGQVNSWATNFDIFQSFIQIYVVAPKYLVPTLCAQAKETFCALLEHSAAHHSHAKLFVRLVKQVYGRDRDEATELREPLVTHFAEYVKDVNENSDFEGVLTDFPEFAVEVTSLLVQQKSEMATGKPGSAKKRKVVTLKGPTYRHV